MNEFPIGLDDVRIRGIGCLALARYRCDLIPLDNDYRIWNRRARTSIDRRSTLNRDGRLRERMQGQECDARATVKQRSPFGGW
jgi:hypothetical protein